MQLHLTVVIIIPSNHMSNETSRKLRPYFMHIISSGSDLGRLLTPTSQH